MRLQDALQALQHNKPLIVKVGDKHQEGIYLASTPDELRDICCETIKNRNDYYEKPEVPQSPEIDAETAAKLPAGRVKEVALEQIQDYARELRAYRKEADLWWLLQRAASTGDLDAAFTVLEHRADYEYEGFEVELGATAKPFKPFKLNDD